MSETNPTVAEVCTLSGPGYGQCWSCPVRACPLWQDPERYFSTASIETAVKAVTATEGHRYGKLKIADPMDLILGTPDQKGLCDDEVQDTLKCRQAAEAVIQGLFIPGKEAAERKVYGRYMNRVSARMPTPDDETWLDEALLRAQAEVAAAEYGCKVEPVVEELAFVHGLKLKPTKEWRNK